MRPPYWVSDNITRDTKTIENGHVYYNGHYTIVERLGAVGPEVLTLSGVDIAWVEGHLCNLNR